MGSINQQQPLVPLADLYNGQNGSNENQIIIQANGDGNCFYYSLIVNFLYQAAFTDDPEKDKAISALNKIFNESSQNDTKEKVKKLIENFKAKKLTQYDIDPIAAQTKKLYGRYLINKIDGIVKGNLGDPFFSLEECKKAFTGKENATTEELKNAINEHIKSTNYNSNKEDFLRSGADDDGIWKDITTEEIFGVTCNVYQNQLANDTLYNNRIALINRKLQNGHHITPHFDAVIPISLHQKAIQYWKNLSPQKSQVTEKKPVSAEKNTPLTIDIEKPSTTVNNSINKEQNRKTITDHLKSTFVKKPKTQISETKILKNAQNIQEKTQKIINEVLEHPNQTKYAKQIEQLLESNYLVQKLTKDYNNPKLETQKQELKKELISAVNTFLKSYKALETVVEKNNQPIKDKDIVANSMQTLKRQQKGQKGQQPSKKLKK